MITHRGALLLVKRGSLIRRLSAFRPSFVAPTGLRYLPRLRPHPRLDLRPRRARYGFPSPVASFRSCPTTTHVNFAFQPSAIQRLQASLVSHSHLRDPPRPCLPPHLDLRSRRPRPTLVLALLPSPSSTMPSGSYRSSSAISTPASLLWRVPSTPLHRLFLPWQYNYSCALSLPFCPALCSCPPPHNCVLPPPHTSASARTPTRYPCHRP